MGHHTAESTYDRNSK